MKKILIFIPILLFCIQLHGQTKKDSTVIEFIKSNKSYVVLSDSASMPESVKDYYNCISKYFKRHRKVLDDYYVLSSRIEDDSTLISIPIYHYDGFKKQKEANDKNEKLLILGNLSGKDGYIKINKSTKKVRIWF